MTPSRAQTVGPLDVTLDRLAATPQVTVLTENAGGTIGYCGPLVRDLIEQLALGATEALTRPISDNPKRRPLRVVERLSWQVVRIVTI